MQNHHITLTAIDQENKNIEEIYLIESADKNSAIDEAVRLLKEKHPDIKEWITSHYRTSENQDSLGE